MVHFSLGFLPLKLLELLFYLSYLLLDQRFGIHDCRVLVVEPWQQVLADVEELCLELGVEEVELFKLVGKVLEIRIRGFRRG